MFDASVFKGGNYGGITDSVQEGIKFGDLLKERKENNQFNDAVKQGASFADLAKINPEKAQAWQMKQDQFGESQRQKQMQGVEHIARLGPSIKDQGSYEAALGELGKLGLDVSQMPKAYDPGLVNRYTNMAMSYAEKMKLENDERNRQAILKKDYDLAKISAGQKSDELKLKEEELRLKREGAASSGENLPIDKKKVVTDLAGKNASKVAIKNQIDSVMENWDKLNDDQKLAQGRQLLKVLNSTEGADAIGVEEANRLGSKLEFAMGNFTNSNPTQFGRDLKGFAEQAKQTSANIAGAVQKNQSIIDETMGRKQKFDADVLKYAQQHGISPEQALQIKNQRMGGSTTAGQ